MINKKDTLLFIGDSITDVGRNRTKGSDLGAGFPSLLAVELAVRYPDHGLRILNRGISGDEAIDLKNRWPEDCLALKPDLVTILVGINDVGFAVEAQTIPTAEDLAQFEANYRLLLETLQEASDPKIVLMEPFVLPYPADRVTWRAQLDPRIQIVRQLADEYEAVLIPLDGLLNAKGIAESFEKYTGDDGVHPTLAGHQAIAEAWLSALNL